MSLKETLAQDLKLSLKEKDLIKRNTVQSIRAAILQFEKDNRTELDDDGIVDVIAKELKKRKDVLPDYEKSGRQALIDQLNREIEIVMGYLPSQLSEDELDEIVKKAVESTGASTMKDMGKIMAAVMPQIKGRADGRAVNALAKKYLV